MSFYLTSAGDFEKTTAWLKRLAEGDIFRSLEKFGAAGVSALSSATPKDTSFTAGSWSYEIEQDATSWSMIWSNSNDAAGTPVAILLQMGHGTGTGGYVEGRDYINPAMRPIFDQMVAEGWKVVIS